MESKPWMHIGWWLEKAVAEHKRNLTAIARALSKDRVQIRRWLRQLGIDLAAFRDASD